MGTFGTPSSYNNTGALGSATNPTTAQGLSRDRENQKAILELPGTQAWVEKTITDGVIVPTSAEIVVLPEGGASTDSLTTIVLTSDGTTTLHEGMLIRLKSANSNTITVVHGTGANNISTIDGNDVVLDTTWYLELKLINGLWVQQETSAYKVANEAKTLAEAAASTPATTTARGIGRVATAADAAPGSPITNGPAFLDAATWKVSATPAAGIIPLTDADGSVNNLCGARYATCATAAATAAKAADIANFQLVKGARVFITFSNANTVAGALTLDVNSTGAKAICDENGQAVSATNPAYFPSGCKIEFIFDGVNWVYIRRIVKSYYSTSAWYQVRSDGWIKQGWTYINTLTDPNASLTAATQSLPLEHKNTSYDVKRELWLAAPNGSLVFAYGFLIGTKTTTTLTTSCENKTYIYAVMFTTEGF